MSYQNTENNNTLNKKRKQLDIVLKAFEESRGYITEINRFENMLKNLANKTETIEEFIVALKEKEKISDHEEKTNIRIYLMFLEKLVTSQ
ncbi:MAG: hypothetical protein ACTSSJ_02655 [Candidatus Odinarchaeia archaeon]